MPSPQPTAVTYVGLPISSGGAHSLARMSFRAAHERTVQFLSRCAEPITPLAYSFRLLDADVPRDTKIEKLLHRRFGPGDNVNVAAERVSEALDFLTEIDPQPASNRAGTVRVWLTGECTFRVRDPASGHVLPGQDTHRYGGREYDWSVPLGTSALKLSLSNRARLAIDLCLPDADDQLLVRVVPWLQTNLPCKLSAKHWNRWTATSTGSFKAINVPAPISR
jgi:hypothetical protein